MTRLNRKFTYSVMAMVIALAISPVVLTAQNGDEPERSPVGVWRTTITQRNCLTGVPNPASAFEALFTFQRDGTMSAWVQGSTLTTTRSPAYGLWKSEHGWSDYSFKFIHLRYSVSTGMFIGKQESGGALVLSESGDEFTTDASTQGFDVNGNPSGPGGCSNSVGTRFKLEQ